MHIVFGFASLTTRQGPLVVEVAPESDKCRYFGTIADAWDKPITDVGLAGEDEGKGDKYPLLPLGYEGAVPQSGYIFRLHGPQEDVFKKPWVLNDIEKVR